MKAVVVRLRGLRSPAASKQVPIEDADDDLRCRRRVATPTPTYCDDNVDESRVEAAGVRVVSNNDRTLLLLCDRPPCVVIINIERCICR